MARYRPTSWRKRLVFSCAVLIISTGTSRAGDNETELRALIEQQGKQIQALQQQLQQVTTGIKPAAEGADGAAKDSAAAKLDDQAVKKIVADYLKDNPGAGMPPSVQTGYSTSTGFVIRSTNNPPYIKWDDECKIPFELRIRGRFQGDYYGYFPTDSRNHLTGVDTGNNTSPDFSQLEVKRLRLQFFGTAFDPDLRYWFELDGSTRGLGALAGSGVPGTNGFSTIGSNGGVGNTGAIAGGATIATVDHAVRLFSAYVAYDWHPCSSQKGCGPDCAEGTYKYVPTVSFLFGKFKPYFAFEEYCGSGNQQMVEYGMSEWFFDADDDNLLTQAAIQAKFMEDRLFLHASITNGNETQIANLQMDDLPGFNFGFWYDFGGNWNNDAKKWDLYTTPTSGGPSDLDWSRNPVARIGAMMYGAPMDRRSEFTVAELARARTLPGAPGGTSMINLLNGGGQLNNADGIGQFSADAFDSYTYEAFIAAKWRGFSILNDWWLRDLDNFRGRRFPLGNYPGNGINEPILYTSNFGTSVFPNHGIIDFGTMLQAGYFIIPKKLEIAGRWSWIRGESGNINGDGTGSTPVRANALGIRESGLVNGVQPPGTVPVGTTFRAVNGAFRHFAEANEYAIGINYYLKGQQLKWQTDVSWYNGGNPAAGGQSPAGFIPGVDGWMVRSQIQFAF
jgi:hypothetical protein